MAISDDEGQTWYASEPLIGLGNIQPSVLRRNNGTLVAYMRENGPRNRIRVAQSPDDGIHWGPVGQIELPNPGAGLDALRLANGHWLLVYNDSTTDRSRPGDLALRRRRRPLALDAAPGTAAAVRTTTRR